MITKLWNAASGMLAQAFKIDTVANNIANVNTTAFKQRDTRFQDLLYRSVRSAGNPVNLPQGDDLPVGQGVRAGAAIPSFAQGVIRETGRELDLALEGDGFFRVLLPDGREAFTRAGNFGMDADGGIVTENGYTVDFLPAELADRAFSSISAGTEGQVRLYDENNEPAGEGTARIYRFENPEGLAAAGGNLWLATENSGEPVAGRPGEDGFAQIAQGALEQSNVRLIEEMTKLILAQRAYEVNSRAVRTADEMWGMANQIRR